ncbi:MAG: hypothetical protein JNL98_15880 [Bryobacterales bacterium]|nr:hypothetical protein [Bryobacterales bacterium]
MAGQSLEVAIVGLGTGFAPGTTQVSAGNGITVSNVVVSSGSLVRAQLAVAAGAALGPRSVIVKTGNEEATLPNALLVTASQ